MNILTKTPSPDSLARLGVARPVADQAWWLVQVYPEFAALPTFALSRTALVFGRVAAPGSVDVGLQDVLASRRHCAIAADAAGAQVTDLGSSNGTFIDGQAVQQGRLPLGGVLRIGSSVFIATRHPPQPESANLGLIGVSHPMAALRSQIRRVATSTLSVLIAGQTGTGKELVAHAVHDQSRRAGKLVPINCAALQPSLVESALFGHRRGAFTSASTDQPGAFRAAHGGTLFLDEIGDLPLDIQPKLLRALESGEITPVGDAHPLRVDVRVVAATHVPLDAAVAAGRFRDDLLARLDGVRLVLPPLAARREDVLLLLRHFLPHGVQQVTLTADFVEALALHTWPHNVREISQLAQRLAAMHGHLAQFDVDVLDTMVAARLHPATERIAPAGLLLPPDRAQLQALLAQHGGNVSELARTVGRSRKQVYRWLQNCGLDPGEGR